MPVACFKGDLKGRTEAKRMNEVKSEAEGVRVSAASLKSETKEQVPLPTP